ncbi:MAG: nitroreductase family protein [Clostridiaceae bacterium]|nr:nitroreductase family protein [Clostridiaceae bacterium]
MCGYLMDIIKKRRSVRRYEKREVSLEDLKELVEAAIWAPSAGNRQSWYFGVITPKKADQVINFSPGVYGDPPNLIVICSDRERAIREGGNTELCTIDTAMAAQNIMLLATEKGLGTCAIKSYNDRALRKILKIPEYIHIELLISVGYSDEKMTAPRRPDREDVIFIDSWDGEDSDG